MMVPTTLLPSGEAVPVLGQGTWCMGEDDRERADEVAALRLGLDLGMTLIDTAEMYAEGGAEEVVADAIAGRRDEIFLVSKVLPQNATRHGTIAACERSLRRLRTDRIDLYLLHWRGSPPFAATVEAFETLIRDGKIRHWGVSNLDLQPWCRRHGMPIMAYSPIEQGRMLGHTGLRQVAERHGATPAQVALAWLLRQEGVIAIPKASATAHVRENRAALDLRLGELDLADLDRAFPSPRGPQPLEML